MYFTLYVDRVTPISTDSVSMVSFIHKLSWGPSMPSLCAPPLEAKELLTSLDLPIPCKASRASIPASLWNKKSTKSCVFRFRAQFKLGKGWGWKSLASTELIGLSRGQHSRVPLASGGAGIPLDQGDRSLPISSVSVHSVLAIADF